MKKIFIISLVLLVIVLIFLGVYNFAFQKNVPATASVSQQSAAQQTAAMQNAAAQKIEKISAITNQGVVAATFDKKNNAVQYFFLSDGTGWKADPDGKNQQQISGGGTQGLKNVAWSANLSKILVTSQVGGADIFSEYDLATQKNTTLKSGLDTAVWDNMGAKIFYKYFDQAAKTRTLNIANPDGTAWQKIADIDARYISIAQIPLTSLVSFWNLPAAKEQTQLQAAAVSGGGATTIFTGRYGADYLWAPNGTMALVSSLVSQASNKMTLGIVKTDGTYSDLGIPTLASKCVWSSDNKTVYYALAGGIPEGAIMPDDYLAGKFATNDTFWKMDITTGQRDRIVDPSEITGTFDSSNLFLSSTEDALYFINKIDHKLYKIAL